MLNLQTIRRVTAYATEGLADSLIAQCRTLGARGYTVVEARGVGTHPTADDPFTKNTHVKIEFLVNPTIGEKLMRHLQKLHSQRQPVTVCIEDVQVADPEHY